MQENIRRCCVMAHLWGPCCGCTQLIKMSSDNENKLDYLANDILSHKVKRKPQNRDLLVYNTA